MSHVRLEDWITRDAIPFTIDSPDAAIDKLVAALSDSVQLLGYGEPLHGGEDFLVLRNRLFQRLVEAHGYSAIAIESSFTRGCIVNDYVLGHISCMFEDVRDTGFSHGFGALDTSRELVEWMRQYNADPSHAVKVRLYGFDSPTEMVGTDSPRQLLHFALDYLTEIDGNLGERRPRIDSLLGPDPDWENPAASYDPSKGIGLSPNAAALRIETEDLITELEVRRPELIAKSDADRYREAVRYAVHARQMLNYHAVLARPTGNRYAECLGLRDAMMADNLAYIAAHERRRGKVFVFAHNYHLKRGLAQWQFGPNALTWWPAGAHLAEMLGPRYAVIGSAVGVSEANGIGTPEPGTLEAMLTASPGPGRFIPTHGGRKLVTADLPIRSSSTKNPGYFPLTPQSLTEYDCIVALDSTTYSRGGRLLP